MHDTVLVLTGILVGTSFTAAGCFLGAYLVKRTYMDVTQPISLTLSPKGREEEEQSLRDMEGYDWDEYDKYIQGVEEDQEEIPEA